MENIHVYENENYRKAALPAVSYKSLLKGIFDTFLIVVKIVFMVMCEPFLFIWHYFKHFGERDCVAHKVALVTGGANGLGRALCIRLAQEKCNIAVADINYKDAQRTALEIANLFGVRAQAFKVDVGDPSSLKKLKEDIESSLGPVDILINNAGILPLFSLRDCPDEDVQRIINVNIISHLWSARTFLDGMMDRKYGRIVAISGMVAKMSMPMGTIYNTTKIAVQGFMNCLYEEIFAFGLEKYVRTSTAFPFFMNTRQELMDLLGNSFTGFPIVTPESAADEIIRGMLNHKMDITIPWPIHYVAWMVNNLLPRRSFKYAKRKFGWMEPA